MSLNITTFFFNKVLLPFSFCSFILKSVNRLFCFLRRFMHGISTTIPLLIFLETLSKCSKRSDHVYYHKIIKRPSADIQIRFLEISISITLWPKPKNNPKNSYFLSTFSFSFYTAALRIHFKISNLKFTKTVISSNPTLNQNILFTCAFIKYCFLHCSSTI